MSEHMMPIPSRLYNAAVGGHVAGADQIIDDETGLTLDKVAGGALEEKTYTSGSDNGMGRVVLRKNLVNGVNTLVKTMINKSNTIYVIQYDFTLGENITIPDNCVLEFDGGSISGNGTGKDTITGNSCLLSGNPDVRCTITNIGNSITHLFWFTKESNKNTAINRAIACAGSTVLDGDGELITLTQTVNFAKENTCSLINLIINFTASADNQSMFLFDSDVTYQGTTSLIKDCRFVLTNPKSYKNVHCIHLRRWYNTGSSKIDGVTVISFTGYMFVCESYLQEMLFERFKGSSVGGFVSFNDGFGTNDAVGDYAKGSSNIISFVHCGIDAGLATNTTIKHIVSVTNSILTEFNNCVFQGSKNNAYEATYYFTTLGITYFNTINTINSWSEFTGVDNKCIIGEGIDIIANPHFAYKYSFVGSHSSLTTSAMAVAGGVSVSSFIEVGEGTYPTINFTGRSEMSRFNELITYLSPIACLNIDAISRGDSKNDIIPNVYFRKGVSKNLLEGIKNVSNGYCKRFYIFENGIKILRQYGTSGPGPLFLVPWGDYLLSTSKEKGYYHLIYRVYPLIEVTESNLADFNSAGINGDVGAFQGSRFNPFIVGQSTNPTDNIWREIITEVNPNITNPQRYSNGKWAYDFAVCEIVSGIKECNQEIIIDPSDNTKLINNKGIQYNACKTDDRPTGLTADMAGLMWFDKTLNKPIWWKGTGWVDATGTPV